MKILSVPYILPDARASYVHWWTREAVWLWFYYKHIEGYPGSNWGARRRWNQRWARTHVPNNPIVSHTTVLPDGEEVTWSWMNCHGAHWSRKNDRFRQGHSKGNKNGLGRRIDSLNREEKTRDYRRSENGNFYGKRKSLARTQIEHEYRQKVRILIKKERWEEIPNGRDPADWWRFD